METDHASQIEKIYRRLRPNARWWPAILLFLCINATFIVASTQILSPLRENIHFVSNELAGLSKHEKLMEQLLQKRGTPDAQAVYEQMKEVGNSSNLILDPQLGSYYLIYIAIALIPDVIQAKEQAQLDALFYQIEYALGQVQKSGISAQKSHAEFLKLKLHPSYIQNFYSETTREIGHQLNERLTREQNRIWELIVILLGFYLTLSFLLAISLKYFVKNKTFRLAEDKLLLIEELKKTNAELESFSYLTAHDLKEPVRTIACFAALAEEEQNDKNQYLAIIKNAALRMEKLIHDVLAYASAGKAKSSEYFDANEVMSHVLEDLHGQLLDPTITLKIDPLPHLTTDKLVLRRVLQNVVANSLYYRKKDGPLLIEIHAEKREKDWVLVIRDNGIGFEEKYAQAVFTPFIRLHDANNRGSGIGLAICKKLLASVGGEIWIEPVPGQGITVFLSVPSR